ncbi:hypothetical protein Sgly_0342 [Syntrophobotulus glycolicus DSM 8271]|uniref:Phage protein n=1 Tax=Syntrophobotulus glycolicus (strain DSM 8271 / FlGlyR) TaxID=645991 RepID=F0SXG2_SYNGF|nr:hypothetical protein [Syntrophobotulus glycolicus]ADY54708.1 hypothetical protein Sgly_0342 [Syntrophobotulus glycolicus DSM 8271]
MAPDYEFYTDTYYGNKIPEADFPRLCNRAESYLDSLGCNLSGLPPDKLSMAICAVAEAWQTNEQGGDVVSQSVGPWSKTFAAAKPKTNEQRLADAARLYIGPCASGVRWV